jgi:putative peptidoglycan lipid II flippase
MSAQPRGEAVDEAVDGPVEGTAARDSGAGLARSTLIMTLGTGLSRVTGLLRVVVLAATLGIAESQVPSTYTLANTTPNIIYELVLGGVLSSIFVPVFVQARKQEGREAADHLARLVLTISAVALGILALAAIAGSEWIMRLYTIRVDDPVERAQQVRVGSQLLVMFAPQILFYGIGTVMTGLLNANRRFGVPMFAPVLNNLVVIATGVTFFLVTGGEGRQLETLTVLDRLVLGLGTTLGVVAMTMVQWPFLRKLGFRYRPAWNLRHPALRKMAGLSAFTLGYVIVNQAALLVVMLLATPIQGGYAAYTTAFMFFQLPHGLFAVSVMTALLPAMSEHAVGQDWASFRTELSRGLRLTAFVLVPAAIGYLVLTRPLVSLLLEHGLVQQGSIELVTRVLWLFVAGLAFFSTFQLVLRAFYALQNTKTPFLVNIIATAVNIVADVVLYFTVPDEWKVAALAGGFAISYLVGSILLLRSLQKRVGKLERAPLVRPLAKITLASVLMGLAALGASMVAGSLIPPGFARDLGMVIAGVALGLTVYILAVRVLGLGEYRMVAGMLHRRLGRA